MAPSLFQVTHDCLKALFPLTDQMKVLLVDQVTLPIISMAFSQAELLESRVFLVDRIERTHLRSTMKNMHCIIFIRPENNSVDAACAELEGSKYESYSISFCSSTCSEHLDRLAYADSENRVKSVKEVFCDFCTVNKDTFLIEKDPLTSIFAAHDAQIMRVAEGLASLLAAHRCVPVIRYEGQSDQASRVAAHLVHILKEDPELYHFPTHDTLLLILDRRTDPLTPLLTPWTYQAMLHEFIGIHHNMVELPSNVTSTSPSDTLLASSEPKSNEMPVSAKDDSLFEENMYEQWGEVCINLKNAVDRCKELVSVDRQSASVEDLKNLLESLPENRMVTMTAAKHVSLASHISEIIKKNTLLEVSLLEQQMYSSCKETDHWNRLIGLSNHPNIHPRYIFRACIIYYLRYECPSSTSKTDLIIKRLPSPLTSAEVSYPEKFAQFQRYIGDAFSPDKLFPESNIVQSVIRTLKSDDKSNSFSKHEPLLKKVVADALTGKLNDLKYRVLSPGKQPSSFTQRIKNVWVFICGGYTLSEAALIHRINSGKEQWEHPGGEILNGKPVSCLLGGEALLNGTLFLNSITT